MYRHGIVVCDNQNAADGVLRFGAAVDADTRAPWDILHNRQAALELGRHGHGDMVAERRNLVAHTLQRVAVPATINNKATSDGIASGFVADKFDVHNTNGLLF